jgi:hypothetical protein
MHPTPPQLPEADENQIERPPKKRQSTNPTQNKYAKTGHFVEGATIR